MRDRAARVTVPHGVAATRISRRAGAGKALWPGGGSLSRHAADALGGDPPARGGSRRADHRARPSLHRPDSAGPARVGSRPSHSRRSRGSAPQDRGARQGPERTSAPGRDTDGSTDRLASHGAVLLALPERVRDGAFAYFRGYPARNRGFGDRRRDNLPRQRAVGARPRETDL